MTRGQRNELVEEHAASGLPLYSRIRDLLRRHSLRTFRTTSASYSPSRRASVVAIADGCVKATRASELVNVQPGLGWVSNAGGADDRA